jgi:hypothetical protein
MYRTCMPAPRFTLLLGLTASLGCAHPRPLIEREHGDPVDRKDKCPGEAREALEEGCPEVGKARPATFASLKRLVGNWQATTPKGNTIRVGYRLVSNDSVLVQTYTPPRGKETLTVFHADGARMLATHYCAQGNQPRLALDTTISTDAKLIFRFVDATNLAHASDEHLAQLELWLTDDNEYTQVETYEHNGKPETTTLRFERARE